MSDSAPRRTPLFALHQEYGAKMVAFAGYEMPVHYADGIRAEHLHTRAAAGLFDVSHMGQIHVRGADAAPALETLLPVDLLALPAGRQKYGIFTNAQGGILDDLMVQNRGDHFVLVVNAACKNEDFTHLQQLAGRVELEYREDLALLALQGPAAAAALAELSEHAAAELGENLRDMKFMEVREIGIAGARCVVSRSGYTGEDGFELSIPAADAERVARRLLAHPQVKPVGLGARDSLRLEAGLCLYGQDITAETTPAEAGLHWAISPARRQGGARARDFPGADIILPQLRNAAGGEQVARRRVGLLPQGRAPVRRGAPLLTADENRLGEVTSGGFGPSLARPISMGYVEAGHAAIGTKLFAQVRGKMLPVTIANLPFVPANFYRG